MEFQPSVIWVFLRFYREHSPWELFGSWTPCIKNYPSSYSDSPKNRCPFVPGRWTPDIALGREICIACVELHTSLQTNLSQAVNPPCTRQPSESFMVLPKGERSNAGIISALTSIKTLAQEFQTCNPEAISLFVTYLNIFI